ncbi:basic membrane protein A [Halogranum amylolyticum]|uniref:Basic membrane protein A n=1 Tax=Halogranum amylolyticum TaxID=660520 RepID=A0A1H8SI53_9EURY|nr:BMP family ABC transporter substrate-binding protein [Halogranum amylolyticum]SEO78352.1 basic membrane protein A [Halogranum amylolyticum]
MDRRTFIKGTGVAGIAGLAGCTGGPEESGDGGDGNQSDGGAGGNQSGNESGGGGSASSDINVGMVYATGGLGDGSFNDQAQTGVQQAGDDFGVSHNEVQPSEVNEFETFQQQFAQSGNYDLICCIGFLQKEALASNAPEYPDQNFMLVDEVVEEPNVASYVFGEEQGSFLVGQMAGLLTQQQFSAGAGETVPDQSKVGFVGGVEGDLIGKFEAGYRAGVAEASEDVEVQVSYVGNFNDTQAGNEAATAMYNDGVDIVYHAAGNAGTGVFQAAQDTGKFAIGVDQDQSLTKSGYANVILASMVKRVDTAVYTSIENVVNDSFGGGSTTTLGLEQEGVAAVYGDQLGSEIPEEVKSSVDETRQAIIDGEISVPTDPSSLN